MDVKNKPEKFSEVRSVIKKGEKSVQYYETQALHQTVFYLIFQLIILSSITNSSSSISCRNWWLPFSLSLISAIIFTITYSSTIHTYLRVQFHHDVSILQLELLRSRDDSKTDIESGVSDHGALVYDKFRMYQRCVSAFIVGSCLVAFTCLVLYACHSVPCGH